MLVAMLVAVPPASVIEASTSFRLPGMRSCSGASTERAASTTVAPCFARYRAMSAPSPRLAPVMIATRPSSGIVHLRDVNALRPRV